MREFAPGDVFVDHLIEGLAGRGGMGVVYRARQLDLDRLVALKVITPSLAEEPEFRRRFVAESKAAASIEHPNVIPVHYAGEREGVLFIVMRYVDGPDLRALVRAEGALDPERAAHFVAQVGAALDAAHAHGLVHRDVKPANVLIDNDEHAYLTDFGLTKRSASTGGVSRAGGWVGTLGYVAPEQIRGEPIDARTDVYALGCVLVYVLTGNAPYQGESDEATLWAHLNAPPPTESVPPEFEGVVARALAKDPSDRYPSAGDLGRAALAAAGRSAVTGPERNVARGAAAPRGPGQAEASDLQPATAATSRQRTAATARRNASLAEGETRLSPAQDGGARSGPGRRRALGAGAGAAAVLAAAVAAVVALTGGEDSPPPGPPPPPPPPSTRAVAEPPIDVPPRPNAITIAGGDVWILSGSLGELEQRDPVTGKKVGRVNVGRGGTALAAGFDSVWVVKSLPTRTMIRYNAKTRRRVAPNVEIAQQGNPIVVTTGAGAVWVGVRTPNLTAGDETVMKIDPASRAQRAITIPGGVQEIAVGEGALWVTNRFRESVVRVLIRSGEQREIRLRGMPKGIAVGEGAVWVATVSKDTITRISPRSGATKAIALDDIPERVTVGGGSVWTTARQAGRLVRIDPDARKVVESIRTGKRPFALDVTRGKAVWLTLLDDDAIQRVTFTRKVG